jgi:hypothetical protein
MKKILFCILGAVLGVAFLCLGYLGYLVLWPQKASLTAVQGTAAKPQPLISVDVLALRMRQREGVYQKLRDDSLEAYAKRHPGEHSYDELAKTTLRLASYLWVWDDYYGEGLRRVLDNYAARLGPAGCPDQIWSSLQDIYFFSDRYSRTDENINIVNHCADLLAATEYPAAFKFESYVSRVRCMVRSKINAKLDSLLKLADLGATIEKMSLAYQELVKEHVPDDVLFDKGQSVLDGAQGDDSTQKACSMGLDRAFREADGGNSTAAILDGAFYVGYAWTARGNGFANTVTSVGWQLMGSRLAQANEILSAEYARDPGNSLIPVVMMGVVLGQHQPRSEMERWFQRGVRANPDNFHLYMLKRWYLYPRWYGSDQDVWDFGMECSKSENWPAKVPLILVESIADAADRDPRLYNQGEVWGPVEKVYRAYLDHFPGSVHYRSLFAKSAVGGEHWEIAKEQFKVLGDNWDRSVFSGNQYAEMTDLTARNAK